MVHRMQLDERPFNRIKDGFKTIELRLFDEKRQLLKVGDEIIFQNRNNRLETISIKIIALHKFTSFAELYKHLDIKGCHTDMLKYYSDEAQQQYGVIGIEIKLSLCGLRQNRTVNYTSK